MRISIDVVIHHSITRCYWIFQGFIFFFKFEGTLVNGVQGGAVIVSAISCFISTAPGRLNAV